jgi:hypothetical protein
VEGRRKKEIRTKYRWRRERANDEEYEEQELEARGEGIERVEKQENFEKKKDVGGREE